MDFNQCKYKFGISKNIDGKDYVIYFECKNRDFCEEFLKTVRQFYDEHEGSINIELLDKKETNSPESEMK
jgi:hypothetical protein